jgi:hypothetical protein
MVTKRRVVLIASVPLCMSIVGLGFWLVTEPQQGAGPREAEQCREYLEQLEMLNRYKLFWTFIQRRVAYSNCIERLVERRDHPTEGQPTSQGEPDRTGSP